MVVIRGHHTTSRLVLRKRGQSLLNLMPLTDQEIQDEEVHFASVVAAFRNYTAHSVKLEIID